MANREVAFDPSVDVLDFLKDAPSRSRRVEAISTASGWVSRYDLTPSSCSRIPRSARKA